jgi:biotin transport system substrate-specific component
MATVTSPTTPALFDAAFPGVFGALPLRLRQAFMVVAGSLLLVLSAKAQVPMWPVPMTMQSFVVLALGAALGPRLGVAAVALYLGQGLVGLPVFAMPGAAGPAYLLGTTGGFLLSFIPAAWIAGTISRRGTGLVRVAAGMMCAHALVLLMGMGWLAWLAQLANGGMGVGLGRAFALGVQPFLAGSLVKVALATALVTAGWSLLDRR